MSTPIGTRNELMLDLADAVAPGERAKFLVVFRLGGFQAFTSEFGKRATASLIGHVVSRLPAASRPSRFYYQPRQDELCGLIAGGLFGVEHALSVAATDVSHLLAHSGISLGFGTVFLPHEASDPIAALALADSRILSVADGEPVFRSSAAGLLLQAA